MKLKFSINMIKITVTKIFESLWMHEIQIKYQVYANDSAEEI